MADSTPRLFAHFVNHSRTVLVALAVSLLTQIPASPLFADDTVVELRSNAKAEYESNGCTGVWNYLWPMAKRGSGDARALLAAYIIYVQLDPTGRSSDIFSAIRTTVFFSAHALEGSDALLDERTEGYPYTFRETILEVFRRPSIAREGGSHFLSCLEAKDATDCIAVYENMGFLPGFESYAAEVDAMARINPTISCTFEPTESQ